MSKFTNIINKFTNLYCQ